MATLTFTEVLDRETTVLQATFPDLADGLSRARALLADGKVFVEESGREAMVQSSDKQQWYHVNGACTCPASTYHTAPRKHRLSLRLYKRVVDAIYAENEAYDLANDTPVGQVPAIPPEYLITIQGRSFVRFEGLLALAHE